jgi:hypothetical protein
MNNEQQSLIDEAYEHYCKEYENGTHRIGTGLLWMAKETKDTFVYRSKADSEFSEKWGLKIEERELSLEERATIWNNTHNPAGNIFTHNQYDENNIPKRAISLRYNHKTITSYE